MFDVHGLSCLAIKGVIKSITQAVMEIILNIPPLDKVKRFCRTKAQSRYCLETGRWTLLQGLTTAKTEFRQDPAFTDGVIDRN